MKTNERTNERELTFVTRQLLPSPCHLSTSSASALWAACPASLLCLSHNLMPFTVTDPRPHAGKASRPPGGSAVPLRGMPPQVRRNTINLKPQSFRQKAEALLLMFASSLMASLFAFTATHHSCTIKANLTRCPEAVKHLSECD